MNFANEITAKREALNEKAHDLRKNMRAIVRSLRAASKGNRISAYFAKNDALKLAQAAEVLARQIRDTYGLHD